MTGRAAGGVANPVRVRDADERAVEVVTSSQS
jgi:hypothetical protein